MYTVEHYYTPEDDSDVYVEWLATLRDRMAKLAIVRRVDRVIGGNFGDHKF